MRFVSQLYYCREYDTERFIAILQNEATDVNQQSLAASKLLNYELRITNYELHSALRASQASILASHAHSDY
ncbi:hypothetical protein [Desmonostoc muscorum]|uniref:hypothetical protein n=1 Tax=Desmonostoc muscorum TaxID=1179 RepID=UPI001F3DD7F8|nr:hypothetical protein [Desmonostoc muscorum]